MKKVSDDYQLSDKDFARLKLDIDNWRRNRIKHSPMPKVLWNSVAALAQKYGAASVARALHVDYKTLRGYLISSLSENTQKGFVEIYPAISNFVPHNFQNNNMLELSDKSGRKIIFHFGNSNSVDFFNLVETFFARRK